MRSDIYEVLAEGAGTHWWFQARERILMEFLRARAPEVFPEGRPGRILDVGAGAGQLARAMTEFGEVTALEGAPEALEVLERVAGIRVVRGILPNPELPDGHFDLVTAFDVLEHIEDDAGAAGDMLGTIRPGGHALVTVPAHPAFWSSHDEVHHHFRRYRPAEAGELLTEAGFEVRFSTPFQSLLFPLFVVERVGRKLLGGGGGGAAPKTPPAAINGLFRRIFASEARWIRAGRRFPFGSSQLVLARRPDQSRTAT